jgi:hypothetical protein
MNIHMHNGNEATDGTVPADPGLLPPDGAHREAAGSRVALPDRSPAGEARTASAVMGYTDAAAFLGVSPRTLERYVREGRVPYVPLPKRGSWGGVRFLRHQLLQWLERRSVKPSRHEISV